MRLISPDALAIATVFQEAEGEEYEGKVAVGEVIRRRTARKYSSDGTIEGTVLRDRQFSGWNASSTNRIRSVRIDDMNAVVQECARAWAESASSNLVPDAVLYYSSDIPAPPWADRVLFVKAIGKHRFFKET